MAYYPLGPLAPDRNPRLNDGLLRVASGVYPTADGYRPAGQWDQAFSALPDEPKGGATFVSPQGTSTIIAGTADTLYKASSGAWEALVPASTLQGGERWRFAQFGGLAIATNAVDPMQKIDLETLAVTDLEGEPPKFEALAVVKGFLVGSCMDGDVLTIAWSGAFNAESWEFGSNQSDYYTLPTGGRVNGILSGEFGLILQRNRIVRLDYVGGNLIFEPNEVSSNIGCVTVHSVAQWGTLGFWLSDSGFVMWDGSQPILIGDEEIDAEFAAAYAVGDWSGMSTAVDPVRKLVMWAMADKIYCFKWNVPAGQRRWTTIPYASPIIFSGVTKDLSVDEQDEGVGSLDDDIDGDPLDPFDDAGFLGGDPRLYAFSSGNALGTFDGTPMAATFTGTDVEPFPGKRADVSFVRPDIDAASGVTVTLAGKQTLAGSATNYASSTIQASGDMPIRASGRYLRATIAVAAGTAWTHAKGYDLQGRPGAGR